VGITALQFEQMQKRLRGSGRAAAPLFEANHRTGLQHEIVLGVDPSLRGTGYGIVRLGKPFPKLVIQGTIRCPSMWEHSRCLVNIAQTLRDIVKEHHPTVCVVEGLFYAQNLKTALIMGEARGASLVAAAETGLEIFEFAPRKVKQAIVGYGAAQKLAVARMVQRMLRLVELPESDAADALALALTYIQEQGRYMLGAPKRV
jgi:crossover junction endodeoxyribonuclease RuvC